MKHFILAIYWFIVIPNAMSQDPNYSGPAKNAVQAFWVEAAKLEQSIAAGESNADKLKIANLARKIQETKAKDAAYNTSTMEATFKKIAGSTISVKPKAEASKSTSHAAILNSQQVANILNSLFHISTQVDNRRLGTIKQEIEDYKKRTAEVLTLDTSGNKSELRQHLVQLKTSFKSVISVIINKKLHHKNFISFV